MMDISLHYYLQALFPTLVTMETPTAMGDSNADRYQSHEMNKKPSNEPHSSGFNHILGSQTFRTDVISTAACIYSFVSVWGPDFGRIDGLFRKQWKWMECLKRRKYTLENATFCVCVKIVTWFSHTKWCAQLAVSSFKQELFSSDQTTVYHHMKCVSPWEQGLCSWHEINTDDAHSSDVILVCLVALTCQLSTHRFTFPSWKRWRRCICYLK